MQLGERLALMPWADVYSARLVSITLGASYGCTSLFEGSSEGDATVFQSLLADIRSTESANHMGGSVQMVVIVDATWASVGFVSDYYGLALYSASEDLQDSMDVVASTWGRIGVSAEDVTVSGVGLNGALSSLEVGIGLEAPLPDREGTVLTGGPRAELDLGLDPDLSFLP